MRSALRAVAGEEQWELLADGRRIQALVRPPARRRTCSYYDSSDIHVNDYRGRIYSTAITKAFLRGRGNTRQENQDRKEVFIIMKNSYSEEDMIVMNVTMWIVIFSIVVYMAYSFYR